EENIIQGKMFEMREQILLRVLRNAELQKVPEIIGLRFTPQEPQILQRSGFAEWLSSSRLLNHAVTKVQTLKLRIRGEHR
ncbi:hypothetical protein FRC00_000234, partial [Tulasnella sp. 408]